MAAPAVRFWIGCSLAASLAMLPASAAPPPNADPTLSGWFQSLSRPWRPGSGATVKCCDVADCRVTEYREVGDHYEVLIDERFPGVRGRSWERVPPRSVVEHTENPTGGAVACWHEGEVFCFVPAQET
ncbi:MAG: hypothetical protein ACREFI_12195 [Stellaceae bacterium]